MGPVAFDGTFRDLEQVRHFRHFESGKETQLDNSRLPFVQFAEPVDGLIQGQQLIMVEVATEQWCHHVTEGYLLPLSPAFDPAAFARMVDQEPAHHLCPDGKKMISSLPLEAILIDQPQVGLVDQGGRLQGVVRTLAP